MEWSHRLLSVESHLDRKERLGLDEYCFAVLTNGPRMKIWFRWQGRQNVHGLQQWFTFTDQGLIDLVI